MPRCPACQLEVEAGARFCGGCGKPIATAISGPAPAPSPAPASAPARATADPLIGRELNRRYRVVRKIGEGGFGSVYEGLQLQMDRAVALKILHPHMTREPSFAARFRREAKAACNLRDPHTIVTYDFDQTEDGILYLAMELLQGRSLLSDVTGGPVAPARAIFLLDQICSSLMEAHARGIIHRDIKPENIFIEDRESQRDFVKVLDFGIAKIMAGDGGSPSLSGLTATGQTLGTLEYMSPEQLAGTDIDGRTDIYSLGCMAYQMLTGRVPFTGLPTAVITAHLHKVPTPPSQLAPQVPPHLDRIILRCLAKEREQRYVDMAALRADLAAASAAVRTVPAVPDTRRGGVPATVVRGRDAPTLPPMSQVSPAPAAAPAARGSAQATPAPVASTPVPGRAPANRHAAPPRPRAPRTAQVGQGSGAGLWIGLVVVVLVAIGGVGLGTYFYLSGQRAGPGEPGSTAARDSAVSAVQRSGSSPGSGAPLATEIFPGKLASGGKGLDALVPARADAVLFAYPKRLLAEPVVRQAWEGNMTPELRALLQQTNTRPAELQEVLLLAPKVADETWGSNRAPPAAIAARKVDGAAIRRVLAQQGAATQTHRGVELHRLKDGVIALHGEDTLLAGNLEAVEAAIDAAAGGAAMDPALRELRAAVSARLGEPLGVGVMRLPAVAQNKLRVSLKLGATMVTHVAAGIGHAAGTWTVQAVAETGSDAAATALRTKVVESIAALRATPDVRSAGLEGVLDAVNTSVDRRRLLLRVSLNDARVRKLVEALQSAAGRGGGTMPPSRSNIFERPNRSGE